MPENLRASIDAIRMRWTPEIAAGNPGHFTVIYHDEAPDPNLLRGRLEHACESTAPFTVRLGGPSQFEEPVRGAFLEVADPSNAVRGLRELVLKPPFLPRDRFGLHVTLLHPTYGGRLSEAWPALASIRSAGSFVVTHVDLIAGVGIQTKVLATLALGGRKKLYV